MFSLRLLAILEKYIRRRCKKIFKIFYRDDIDSLTKQIENEKDINKLKILLANKATTILHGSKAAKDSAETAKETFVKGGLGKNIPEREIEKKIIIQGINIIELIFQNNLAQSKSEARRILKNNGVKLNDITVNDVKKIVNIGDVQENNFIKLSIGKKNHIKVKVIWLFSFEFSRALVINRGVSVLIGFTVVLRSFGNPLTLKLIPNTPS